MNYLQQTFRRELGGTGTINRLLQASVPQIVLWVEGVLANFRCSWRLLKGGWRRDDGGHSTGLIIISGVTRLLRRCSKQRIYRSRKSIPAIFDRTSIP